MEILVILFLIVAVCGLFAYTFWRRRKLSPFIKRDMYKALEKRAKKGDVEAMYRFAQLFYEENNEVYFPLIFKWVSLLAARKRDPAVWLLLGDMYTSAWGTDQDLKRALSSYEQALSADIASGRNTDLSKDAHDYLESQIIRLRRKLSAK